MKSLCVLRRTHRKSGPQTQRDTQQCSQRSAQRTAEITAHSTQTTTLTPSSTSLIAILLDRLGLLQRGHILGQPLEKLRRGGLGVKGQDALLDLLGALPVALEEDVDLFAALGRGEGDGLWLLAGRLLES